MVLLRCFLPEFLAAIRPTLAPGGAFRDTVVDFPGLLCLPPPCGWLAAVILTPWAIGYTWPFALAAWWASPAFMRGFSVRPPPETMPIVALDLFGIVTCFLEGSLKVVP